MEMEDITHIIFDCTVAMQFWSSSSTLVFKFQQGHGSLGYKDFLTHSKFKEGERFQVLAWAIWNNRHVVALQNSPKDPLAFSTRALTMLEALQQTNRIAGHTPLIRQIAQWRHHWKVTLRSTLMQHCLQILDAVELE
ncbi:hypothetical protein ACH5RR_018042 [Cinchona calisaya]|uniref:Uncharacterized protein n=1 Tax=Cinchona calisaya TaxID=153742 RepID=A0ABD2ZLL7_9GENT